MMGYRNTTAIPILKVREKNRRISKSEIKIAKQFLPRANAPKEKTRI